MANLFNDPILHLFIIIVFGIFFGYYVKIKKFYLGSAGTIILPLIFGYLGLKIPPHIENIGLLMFIYAVGTQAGPNFFKIFRRNLLPILGISVTVAVVILGEAFFLNNVLHWSKGQTIGAILGSFNAASALATVLQSVNDPMTKLSYGLTNPVGVIVLIVFLVLLPSILKINLKKHLKAEQLKEEAKTDPLREEKVVIKNKEVIGKTLGELEIREKTGVNIIKHRHGKTTELADSSTVLEEGDVILCIGPSSEIKRVCEALGEKTYAEIGKLKDVEAKKIIVSGTAMIGKTLRELEIETNYHVIISQIWRAELTFTGDPDFVLEAGDTILAIGRKKDLDAFMTLAGKYEKSFSHIDFFSFSFAATLGIIIGSVNIPLAASSFKIGSAAGTLLVALVIGYLRSRGFQYGGQLSASGHIFLRDLGLIFFLAGVGVSGGSLLKGVSLLEIYEILLAGAVNMAILAVVIFILTYYFLKYPIIASLASVCGAVKVTPGLGYLVDSLGSEEPVPHYSAIYPITIILFIIIAQFLATVLK